MNISSAGDASGNVSLSAADNDADTGDTSLYAVVYGLGAVAIVVAICLRGIIFMTVRYITLSPPSSPPLAAAATAVDILLLRLRPHRAEALSDALV